MSSINAVVDLTLEDRIAVLMINSPPVNALSHRVREGLARAMRRAVEDAAAEAIVLICAGKTFIVGADIAELGKPVKGPSLLEIEAEFDNSPKPVVAAIHGAALGGGLELALCCHYRIATPSAKCGLPEVHLGLLPGAGGTQRLPRIVGPEQALQMITSGMHVDATTCLAAGLLDEIAPEGELRSTALNFARRIIEERGPLKRVRDLNDKVVAARGKPEIFEQFRSANARKLRGFAAPERIIRCVEAAVNLPFDAGLEFERKLFLELLQGTQSAAQRHAFLAERQVWKVPDVPGDVATLPIRKVGVVGAGTMGGGIAMNFANIGLPVTLVEANQDALDRGFGVIRRNYENSARRGKLSIDDVEERMRLLQGALELERVADCDLVIEAVFENMSVKKEVFHELDRIAKHDAILATNTSGLDVNEIAAATQRPQSVLGLHFFSPANVMRLLEVVRGRRTSKSVIATAMQLARRMGKVAVLVGVCPGFLGNRMLYVYRRQAIAMLLEGASPWQIDKVMHDFGLPMGPFAAADLAGLDIGWSRETSASSTVREVLCEIGRRGQKTGAGYYDYDAERNAKPSQVTEKIIQDFITRAGVAPRKLPTSEILERCVYPLINEGAKIIEERIAIRASDIDVAWINGYGWPAYRGGPMFYGDTVGLPTIVGRLKEYEAKLGADFSLSPLLEQLAVEGRRFQDL